MGDKKYVQSYLSKLTEILSQMRYYGQNISSEDVISQVLRSLNRNWKYVVYVIVESKDLSS